MSRTVQLNSNNGHSFCLTESECAISNHICETLNISDQYDEQPTLDLIQINGANLEIIVNFMKEHAVRPILESNPKSINLENLSENYKQMFSNVKMVSENLQDIHGSDVSIVSLLIAANHLQIESLQSILIKMMISSIEGKTLKQMFAVFSIPEDTVVTPEEVEEIRQTYSYAFEEEGQEKAAA